MNGFDRYSRVMHWLRKRYTGEDGYLLVSVRGQPTMYSRLELAFARRYMKMPKGWGIIRATDAEVCHA